MKKKYLRQSTLWFYLLLPYLALVGVAQNKATGSGWFFLAGWVTTFIFQIFFIAVNQSKANRHMPLYREAAALVLPLLVLLRQWLIGGDVWLFFIELMALEILVLNVGVMIAVLSQVKKDWQAALFAFVFLGMFLLATFWGLINTWLLLVPAQPWLYYLPLMLAFISGCIMHLRFLLSIAKGELALNDADIKNPVLFFVGQIVVWFGLMVWLRN